MDKIKLTIDGKEVEAEEGCTVLQAALSAGIDIPRICAHEDLEPYGSCRLCVVEIEGIRGYPTSCTTPAQDGMAVRTQTDELKILRARILELMLSGHPNACLACPHREDCEKYRPRPTKAGRTTRCGFCSNRDSCTLRDLTFQLSPEYELQLPTLYSEHNVEKFDPFMDRDFNLCILCGRCWRICEKIHGKPYINIVNRGRWARPGTGFNKGHVHSGCTFCGACIDICPTGTLSDRYARWYGRPEAEVLSACTICPEGCDAWVWTRGGRVIATRMKDFTYDSRLCAIGRFAYAQLMNAPDRARRCMVRKGAEQVPVEPEAAIQAAAGKLKEYSGDKAAVLISECELRETRHLYEKLAKEVLNCTVGYVPAWGEFGDVRPDTVRAAIEDGRVKAVVMAGDFLDPGLLEGLEALIVIDWLPSPAAERADAFFPAAVLAEVGGTYMNVRGEIKSIDKLTEPPGDARSDWEWVCQIASATGASGFEFDSVHKITPQAGDSHKPSPMPGSPRDSIKDLPAAFRGHYMADTVCALEAMGMPMSPLEPSVETEGGFLVIEKQEVIPNFHLMKIEAPQVAEFARPGQFVIVMANERSERVPYTIADWDAEAGTVTLVVEEVGRSSREAAALRAGDRMAHIAGPLGTPFDIEKAGTVALGGGCYGIGGIYPIARAMKEAGNRVITVLEAPSHYLFYWEDKLRQVSDELILATKDGSRGVHGGVQEVFADLAKREDRPAMFVTIGCTFMMRMVSEATKDTGIPNYVALNPIMVDGTGMCGACRVSVDGETRFACVDGPIFNGHEVDWDELFSRRGAYAVIEIEAMPQGTQMERAAEKLGGRCTGGCTSA